MLFIRKSHALIVTWIESSLKKKVQKLDINLSKYDSYCTYENDNVFTFPHWLFNKESKEATLNQLSFSYCLLDIPRNKQYNLLGFRSLKSLTLRKVFYSTNDNIFQILSSCLSLEWLSLERCKCSRSLRLASETRTPLKLKHLNIYMFVLFSRRVGY